MEWSSDKLAANLKISLTNPLKVVNAASLMGFSKVLLVSNYMEIAFVRPQIANYFPIKSGQIGDARAMTTDNVDRDTSIQSYQLIDEK